MFVLKRALKIYVEKQCIFLSPPTGYIAAGSVRFVRLDEFQPGSTMDEDPGSTPHMRDELHKLGFKKYLKKYRQYAQYNYEEWRYPEKQRAIDISCTRQVADPYKVDENSGLSSYIRTTRNKLNDIRADLLSYRILKRRVPEFHRRRFPAEAQEIYTEVHDLLNTVNWTVVKKPDTLDRLDKLVTEYAFPEMVRGLSTKTLRWKYLETIEPPRVVKVRTPMMLSNDNYYGQVTVRFHSKQSLAIYDRFGRLMMGSNDVPRDVLEYVVFERHISHPYGMWRIHSKIPASHYREPARRTVAVIKPKPVRIESKEWHEEEEKECVFKWYPQRHDILARQIRNKRRRRGAKFFSARRKYTVLNINRTKSTKMRPKSVKLLRKAGMKVDKMRESGSLPPPPLEPNP